MTHVSGYYPWPFDGNLTTDNTALLIINMQVDYCGRGGWIDQLKIGHREHATADRADRAGLERRCAKRAIRSCSRAKATDRICPTSTRTKCRAPVN